MGGETPQMPINSPTIQQPPMGDDGMMDTGMEEPMNQPMENGDDNTKEVQELSGKLSQKLGEINSSNPNSDLSKYAANMVLTQAIKGMDDSDAEEVKSKLNNTNNDSNEMNNQMPMGESKMDFNKLVNEIVNKVLDSSNREKENKKITNPMTKKKNPFNVNIK